MKKSLSVSCLTCLFVMGMLSAVLEKEAIGSETYGSPMGVGLMLGNPLGMNMKIWVEDEQAIDGGFGLGFLGGEHLQVHSTYLFHFKGFKKETAEMKFYLGEAVCSSNCRNSPYCPSS